MLIRFRVHQPADPFLDTAIEHERAAYRGGPVAIYHRHVKKTRSFILGRPVALRTTLPDFSHLLRVVGIGHESGVMTIDLR
jgi:hypothetical protein